MAIGLKHLHDIARKSEEFLEKYIRDYPDVDSLIATGRLIKRSGWYSALDEEALKMVSPYISASQSITGKKLQFKLRRPASK